MALAALATATDLAERGVTLNPGEQDLAATYLAIASAAVREAARVPISETTSTVGLEGKCGRWLALPGLPVTAVAAVELDSEAITDWRLRSHALWRPDGWQAVHGEPSEVTVTYTHGLPEVPADIVDLVCRLATAALVAWRANPDGSGLAASNIQSERIGDYSVVYNQQGVRLTEMELPERIREQLAARFGGNVAVLGSR
ncbi:MAG: hypothetical protein ACRDS1_01445 [Pseudonocardiaceae bacterium]